MIDGFFLPDVKDGVFIRDAEELAVVGLAVMTVV